MCGIVGLALAPAAKTRPDVEAAVRALDHRGPDARGSYVDATFALGHTRLAIIDPSPTGAQPMHAADGRYIIVFNGEVYNFRELRLELESRGVRLRGTSDTEVLLECYRLFGPDVLSRLNGIFAFAIADLETKDLLVARDPIGVKPLYYSQGAFGFAFASEIKALLKIAPIAREIDPVAIRQYLTFLWSPGERTPLSSVSKLDPGTAFIVRAGQVARTWRYWVPPVYDPRRDSSRQACADELADCVTRAVERQMVSDAPLGAFLSGGLDSTAIVAAAQHHAPDLNCFTMAIQGGGAEAEMTEDLPYARAAAKALGVRLTEVPISPADIADGIAQMVADLDEPLADPACLNVFFISKLARANGIKVLLSGVGGDDLMSGYRRHTASVYNHLWNYMPRAARGWLASAARSQNLSRIGLRRGTKLISNIDRSPDERIASSFAWTPPDTMQSLLNQEFFAPQDSGNVFDVLLGELAAVLDAPDLEKCLMLDRRFFLADHNLTYTDKMAMAAGVEVRVPLLDLELVSFAARIPAEWKHRGLTAKALFRQSQRGRVPQQVIDRPKSGFGVPLRAWMAGPLVGLSSDLLSAKTLEHRGLFDPKAVARLIEANDARRVDASYTLFSILCIELWCRHFLDQD